MSMQNSHSDSGIPPIYRGSGNAGSNLAWLEDRRLRRAKRARIWQRVLILLAVFWAVVVVSAGLLLVQ